MNLSMFLSLLDLSILNCKHQDLLGQLIFFNIFFCYFETPFWGLPGGAVVKNLLANAGDAGDVDLIPGLGRSPGGGNSNLLQYSCLGNPMQGAWQATAHRVTKSRTRLSS